MICLFHTADDSLYERQSRILGSRFNLPSELFETPKFYLQHPEAARAKGVEDFEVVLGRARLWLRNLFEAERLIVADINEIAPTFPALGRYVTDMRKRFPDKYIIVMEDNFHLLEMPGYGKDSGEAKIAARVPFCEAAVYDAAGHGAGHDGIAQVFLGTGEPPVLHEPERFWCHSL